MNTELPVIVDAAYSQELLEAAAKCFIGQHFRGRGRDLVWSSVIIAIGMIAAYAWGARGAFWIALITIMILMGPLYIAYLYALFPRHYAERVARSLAPTAQVSFSESTLEISAKGRTHARIPWASMRNVWECPVAFLVVISELGKVFIVVPKTPLPPIAYELLAAKVREHAA